MEDRKEWERAFHNEREIARIENPEAHDAYYKNRQFYRITGNSRAYLSQLLDTYCPDADALDYCCGTGLMSREMAKRGARVVGIDISDISIRTARERAAEEGLAGQTTFVTGDAEKMSFPDESFDVVLASGVLHHVDLEAAFREIARVLRPSGVVIGIEALAHNPLIMAYRRRTPHLRTPYEVDHILRVEDIHRARQYFAQVDITFWHLASIAAIPFRNTSVFRPLLSGLNAVDRVLTKIPGIQKHAWQSIFVLSHPIATYAKA